MAAAPLTRDVVFKAVGEVDDRVVADLVATGVTAEELAEARAWVESDEALVNSGKLTHARRARREGWHQTHRGSRAAPRLCGSARKQKRKRQPMARTIEPKTWSWLLVDFCG